MGNKTEFYWLKQQRITKEQGVCEDARYGNPRKV